MIVYRYYYHAFFIYYNEQYMVKSLRMFSSFHGQVYKTSPMELIFNHRVWCSRPCTRCGPSGLLTLYRILLLSLMIITTEHNRCKFVICYDVEKKNRCTIYRQSNKYPITGCGVPGDALAVG